MSITPQQRVALEEVVQAILAVKSSGGKRQRAEMFLELVDRTDWPQYYEVIPEPRCLDNIKAGIEKGRYKEALDAYTDLSLVFWNALYYNEAGSQIARDAQALKTVLETEWKKWPVLPAARSSPPPSSAQRVHEPGSEETDTKTEVVPGIQQPKAGPPVTKPAMPRQSTPEVEVDIMDSDGGDEDQPMPVDRDPLSEEIVRNLERGLPRWAGFGELGWMEYAPPERLIELVMDIKAHKDIVGNRLAVSLEEVPEDPVIPNLSYAGPISLKMIEARTHARQYLTAKEFDMDMLRLFEKARRWQDPGGEAYGRVLLLQRLYQALTSPAPPVGPPFLSTSNFAALRAGPGIVKPVHGADSEGVPSVTTHRVLTKDRTFVDELHYKGWTVKLAEWVHLANPDDPSRPIIGQIFRCWVSDEPARKGQLGVTVSWYYRPEQTYHPPSRQFWQHEVFKTSHFADHPIEDLIEKIACQFTARHVRGRPRPPFWYVGWPLYVCDARYNDRERIFVKIKNWNSCVPEEVRKSSEFMPIYPFERMVYPVRLPSPLISKGAASKFPGVLLPETGDGADDGTGPNVSTSKRRREATGTSQGVHQQHHTQTPAQHSYYSNALYNTPQQPTTYQQPQPTAQTQSNMQRLDRSLVSVAGGLAAIGGAAQVENLPAETAKHFDRDPESNQVLWFASPPVDTPRHHPPKPSLEYLAFLAKKRKREDGEEDGDGEDGGLREKGKVPPTVTETMRALAKEIFSKP